MKAAAIVVIGFLIASAGLTAASATPSPPQDDEECVPVDAVAYQAAVYETVHYDAVTEMVYHRYSWTPGNHDNDDDAPDETGSTPGGDAAHWQLNQKPDPKDDPIGVAFKKGRGDNASWFFWLGSEEVVTEAYDEQVLVTPEVLAVEGVTCPGDPEIVTEWYTWATGSWAPDAQDADDVSWPQTLVGPGQIAPTDCETTYQQDKYVGTREAIDAVIDDGILTNIGQPEDHLIVVDWEFASTAACPPEQPEDIVVVGKWQDGKYQCGATEVATTRETSTTTYMFVEGDEQGSWVAQTPVITMETSTRELTPEEQEANVCPFEVTAAAASVVDPPICGPNNDTVTITPTEGVTYSDTGWVEGERTITASAMENYVLTGTTSWTFTDKATVCPIEVTAVFASVIDPPVCGPNNDTVTIPEVEGVTYSDTGWVEGQRTITATATKGYVLTGTTSWTFTDEATTCPIDETGGEVTTAAPTVVAKCFPNNDTVTIPEVEGVIYSDTGWVSGQRTITASADELYTLVGDTSWTFTDVPSAACPPVGPVFAADELAFTGTSSNTGGFVALAILLITSGTALVARKRRAF